MKAFIKLNKGMLKMPLQWQLWMAVLVAANLVAALFFLHRIEAQVVLGTLLASMILMTYLTARFGFTRILGLARISHHMSESSRFGGNWIRGRRTFGLDDSEAAFLGGDRLSRRVDGPFFAVFGVRLRTARAE